MNLQNWFMGVVEDVSDPLGMGRVKVRCFGYHNPDRSLLPTKDLPWASPILPPTGPSVGGSGQTSGIQTGSMVFGAFYDGNELQDAMILGVFPGGTMTKINYDPIRNFGFGSIGGTGGGLPGSADAFGNSGRSVGGVYGSASGPYYNQQGFYDYPAPTFVPGGSQDRLVEIAKSQVGIVESAGSNRGPGIGKYWASTSYPGGYGNPWCAAFVSWVVESAGILPDEKLPNTARAYSFRDWAAKNPDVTVGRRHPRQIYAGDIIIYTWSHIGIAVTNSNGSTVQAIDGNTSNGVYQKTRNLSQIADAITIKSTGLQPLGGGPALPDGFQGGPLRPDDAQTNGVSAEDLVNSASTAYRRTPGDGDPYSTGQGNELPVAEPDPILRSRETLGGGLFPAGSIRRAQENNP